MYGTSSYVCVQGTGCTGQGGEPNGGGGIQDNRCERGVYRTVGVQETEVYRKQGVHRISYRTEISLLSPFVLDYPSWLNIVYWTIPSD